MQRKNSNCANEEGNALEACVLGGLLRIASQYSVSVGIGNVITDLALIWSVAVAVAVDGLFFVASLESLFTCFILLGENIPTTMRVCFWLTYTNK